MARQESDRENLLREATALVERIELEVAGFEHPVVVGFRRTGCGSIYFGADPVVQFTTAGELRRGYRGGRLLKADRGRLVELQRERTAEATILVRNEFTFAEEQAILTELTDWIQRLRFALQAGNCRIVGQVPEEGDVLGRVTRWLADLPEPLRIAASAGIA